MIIQKPRITHRKLFPIYYSGETTHELVYKGKYVQVDPTFLLPKNLHVLPKKQNANIEAVCFDTEMRTEGVRHEITSQLRGKIPASFADHLAVGAAYPAIGDILEGLVQETKILVVTLDEIPTAIVGDLAIPVLTQGGGFGKKLSLQTYQDNGRSWPAFTFFLVKYA